MGCCSAKDVQKFSQTLVTLVETLILSDSESDFNVGKQHLLTMLDSIDRYKPAERQKILALITKLIHKLEQIQLEETKRFSPEVTRNQ